MPGATLVYSVEQTFTVAGTIDDFNSTAFQHALADAAGVPAAAVTVTASSASVLVATTIATQSAQASSRACSCAR